MTEEERTKFLKNFKFKIENERLENNQCPKCSIDLEYITKKDNEWLEYFGTPCSQTYTYKKCDNCGWRDDK